MLASGYIALSIRRVLLEVNVALIPLNGVDGILACVPTTGHNTPVPNSALVHTELPNGLETTAVRAFACPAIPCSIVTPRLASRLPGLSRPRSERVTTAL